MRSLAFVAPHPLGGWGVEEMQRFHSRPPGIPTVVILLTVTAFCFGFVRPAVGEDQMSTADIARLRAANVPADYTAKLKDLGVEQLSARDIVNLWSLRVSPDYVADVTDVGLPHLSSTDIVKLYAVRVPPDYLRNMRDIDLTNLSSNDIVKLWSSNVSAEYIKELSELAEDLSASDIAKLWAVKVSPEYLQKLRELDIKLSPDDEIARHWKINVPPIEVKEMLAGMRMVHPHRTAHYVEPGDDGLAWPAQMLIGILMIIAISGVVAYVNDPRFVRSGAQERWSDRLDERLTAFEKRSKSLRRVIRKIDQRLDHSSSPM